MTLRLGLQCENWEIVEERLAHAAKEGTLIMRLLGQSLPQSAGLPTLQDVEAHLRRLTEGATEQLCQLTAERIANEPLDPTVYAELEGYAYSDLFEVYATHGPGEHDVTVEITKRLGV